MPAWMTSELRELVCVPIASSASRITTSRPARARARATPRPTTPAPMTTASSFSNEQASPREVLHEPPGAEGPRLAILRVADAVHQRAELRRGDGDDVADLVGEALARRIAVLDGSEHRAEEEDRAVGILVMGAEQLSHQVFRIAADLRDRRASFQAKSIAAL